MLYSPSRKPLGFLHAPALLFISLLGLFGLWLLHKPGHVSIWNMGFVSLGLIGTWRWTLFAIRISRSWIYQYGVFRRWRRRANAIPVEDLPPVCFLVPTYKEKPWITERVFRAIVQEAKTLAHPVTLLVSSSSDAENAAILAVLKAEDPDLASIRLIQMTQKDGKRKAMADGLRELARLELPEDTVVILMDGDSELSPGVLRQSLPFFRLFPRMGALTTDEMPIVHGSYLFSEWFHLRFAQRHYQMCSDSLSRKVMCLTGRFSLFRASAAFDPSFAAQLENDNLDDWLWGRFKFLSGDDKSTWFWLLRHGYEMLYIPDALVYSIETLSGSGLQRAHENMRRWYGNMLRNNTRALALGPRTTGWYLWQGLLDQRISIWTSLISPGILLISLIERDWIAASVITAWICFSRPVMLLLLFWGRPSYPKPIHFPILLGMQWLSSLVKIGVQMNLATQKWSNRGNQSLSVEGSRKKRAAKLATARFLLASQAMSFVLFLLWLSGVLNPIEDATEFWVSQQRAAQQAYTRIEAIDHGIIPNDGKDDAVALQALIDRLPVKQPTQITLPIGEIDLFHPVTVSRSNLRLQGRGAGRTVLQVHVDHTIDESVLQVRPKQVAQPVSTQATTARLESVQLSGFTLSPVAQGAIQPPVDGIVLENVVRSSVKNINFQKGSRYPLVLKQTQDVTVEYVTIEGTPNQIVLKNAVNTHTGGLSVLPAES